MCCNAYCTTNTPSTQYGQQSQSHTPNHPIPSRWSNSNDLILCACCNALLAAGLVCFFWIDISKSMPMREMQNSWEFVLSRVFACGNTQMQNSVMICTIRTWADYFLRPTISLSFLRFTSRCDLIYLKWFLISWAAFSVMFVCLRSLPPQFVLAFRCAFAVLSHRVTNSICFSQ